MLDDITDKQRMSGVLQLHSISNCRHKWAGSPIDSNAYTNILAWLRMRL
jgi:hypothetical protein